MPPYLEITSSRLVLVAATLKHLDAELDGRAALQASLRASVPDEWPPGEYDRSALEFFQRRLSEGGPPLVGWLNWYAISRSPTGDRGSLVAGAGFFGPPVDGVVEIGYSVVPAARRQGYATEIVRSLCAFAFSHDDVHTIVAHTVADNVPSWRALLRCGFTEVPDTTQSGRVEYVRHKTHARACP